MADFGFYLLLFLFPFALFSAIAGFIAGVTGKVSFYKAAERGVYASFVIGTGAILSIIYLLVTSDMSIEYVASNTNYSLPMFYKIVALWAGHSGSLLLWTWIILTSAAIVVFQNRNKNQELMPFVVFSIMGTAAFFAMLNTFISNPFDTIYQEIDGVVRAFTVPDGRGLNPLLQHPAMIIHPPVLYIGYVGTVIPFGFAMAALISGKLGTGWIKITRRWALTSWAFLTAGILLGGKWAYVELGWGGYWAWDPVENASLLPWLTGTAYLHSVMIQERKGMLKNWNVALVIATYLLAIFGTFLTRSGVVSSVHAFANSGLGPAFAGFLLFALVSSVSLMYWRRSMLRPEEYLDSLVSRESGFLFNNLMFFLATIAVLWGTMFPVISEAITGDKITVGPPWFNNIMVPIGLAVLLLTGVGPLLAWKHTSKESLKKSFTYPTIISISIGVILYLFGIHDVWALASFCISTFVLFIISVEFVKGTRIRAKNSGESYLKAQYQLIIKNTRRYGGYLIHSGVVVIFMGITGTLFNSEIRIEVGEGESFELKDYRFTINDISYSINENYRSDFIEMAIEKDGVIVHMAKPEKRYYFSSEQPTTEVDIYSTIKEDLYSVISGVTEDEKRVIIQVYHNPLVKLIWIGSYITMFGIAVAMFPNKREKGKVIRKETEPGDVS
jgi:cytochrome c-type biogenesis protein CcmF